MNNHMGRREILRAGMWGLAAMAGGSALGACGAGGRQDGGDSSEAGITAEAVKIGAHFPLTGVAAPGYSEIPTGTQAYFDFVNAHGGINGRKIEYIFRDDAYNPTTTSQVVNELVLQDQVFAIMGGLGTPTHSAVLDFLNSERVPDLFVASGSLLWNQPDKNPYTFGWQPDYEVEGKIIGQYVKQQLSQARVGLFLQDDDFGDDGEKGVRAYINDQVVGVERYVPGNIDVTPQLTALQAAGADVVLGFTVPSYTALSQLVSLKLNYKPQWIYSNVGSDPTLVGSLLSKFSKGKVSGASMLDGAITTEYLAGVDQTDDPWVQLWQRVWEAHGHGGQLTNFRLFGMAEAYTFVQTLQAAGPNPTRDGLVKAVEKAGAAFQGPGLAPFRYSDKSHAGISGTRVSRIAGNTTEELSPVLVTDNGTAKITEHTSKNAGPPPNGIPHVKPVD